MRALPLRLLWPALVLSCMGCGMEAVDTRMQTRAESPATDQFPLKVPEAKYVCTNLVSVSNQPFDPKSIGGDAENPFGPYVACMEPLDIGGAKKDARCKNCQMEYSLERKTRCTNASCGEEVQPIWMQVLYLKEGDGEEQRHVREPMNDRWKFYRDQAQRKSGEPEGDYEFITRGPYYQFVCPKCKEDLAPKKVAPLPALECPHCAELIDPVAYLLRGKGKTSPRGQNACPKCKKFFSVLPTDIITVVDNPHEAICPSCKQPIDPTLNICSTGNCKLAQAGTNVRVLNAFIGPCWRCGGTTYCPECAGSGKSLTGAIVVPDYRTRPQSKDEQPVTPSTCWYCVKKDGDETGTGLCPECDYGFTVYEGGLPPEYQLFSKGKDAKAIPAEARKGKWKIQDPKAAAGNQQPGGQPGKQPPPGNTGR